MVEVKGYDNCRGPSNIVKAASDGPVRAWACENRPDIADLVRHFENHCVMRLVRGAVDLLLLAK
jgi:hypothetical protein